jgi:aryl-alcohol dehydrogenase-like predicted oxidoreductase
MLFYIVKKMAEDYGMHYSNLGRTGLKVSRLSLGTMMFGGRTDEATSLRVIDAAAAHGVNFIDTADAYNEGDSERIVGSAIRSKRSQWVLATKLANPVQPGGADVNARGLSRRYVIQAVEASLQRLGTDAIDLLYLHREDHSTPLAETVGALADLIRQGKVRYFGVSNFRAWRVAEISTLADQAGIDRPAASQPCYNIANRMPELEHFSACEHYGLGIVPYSPLARGVLSGKYKPDAEPAADSRAAQKDRRLLETEWRPESIRLAQEIKDYAEARGVTTSQFATAWVLHNRLVTSAIAGPRTEAQWQDYLGALAVELTAEDEAFIDRLVAPGHPSTPGYTDPGHPCFGRIAASSGQAPTQLSARR